MKILSKKKYNKLIEDFEELQEKVKELKRTNESIEKKLCIFLSYHRKA